MDSRLVVDGYKVREAIVRAFFEREADRLAELCHRMARRFARSGRLIAFGVGAAATDAQHVSVEFVHPVIVGKRALPALALINDVPSALGLALEDRNTFFARHVDVIGTPEDIAIGMIHSEHDVGLEPVGAALKQAQAMGMLTVALCGGSSPVEDDAAFVLEVPSEDPFIVQEVHETLYHVLWELVHVFFEHKGLLDDRPQRATHETGRSSFLYPFLQEDEKNLDGVMREVRESMVKKSEDVIALRSASCDPEGLVETAHFVRERIDAGGKVLAFGNGGSATDAQDFVTDLVVPGAGAAPISAISLTNDAAVVTAVGNDVGFENVFARQVIAYGLEGDVAVAISTSGGSRNVLAALEEARRRGLLTVGLSGYGGGRQAEICDRAHTIDADYIPRIQEAQATQYHLLCRLLHAR